MANAPIIRQDMSFGLKVLFCVKFAVEFSILIKSFSYLKCINGQRNRTPMKGHFNQILMETKYYAPISEEIVHFPFSHGNPQTMTLR